MSMLIELMWVCLWQVTTNCTVQAARETDIIKPGYLCLEAVKPVNPGSKNTPRVYIPYLQADCQEPESAPEPYTQ